MKLTNEQIKKVIKKFGSVEIFLALLDSKFKLDNFFMAEMIIDYLESHNWNLDINIQKNKYFKIKEYLYFIPRTIKNTDFMNITERYNSMFKINGYLKNNKRNWGSMRLSESLVFVCHNRKLFESYDSGRIIVMLDDEEKYIKTLFLVIIPREQRLVVDTYENLSFKMGDMIYTISRFS